MWTCVYTHDFVKKLRIPFYSDSCCNFKIVFHGKCAVRFLKGGKITLKNILLLIYVSISTLYI